MCRSGIVALQAVLAALAVGLGAPALGQSAAVINPDAHRVVKFGYLPGNAADAYLSIAQGLRTDGEPWDDPSFWSGVGEAPDFIGSVLSENGYAVDYFEADGMPPISPEDYDVVFVQDPLREHLRPFDKATTDAELPDLLEHVTGEVFLSRLRDYVAGGGKLVLVGDAVRLLEDGPGRLGYGKTIHTVSVPHAVTEPNALLPPRWLFVRGNPFCCVDRTGEGTYIVEASEWLTSGTTIANVILANYNDINASTIWSDSVYYPTDGVSLLDVRVVGSGDYVLTGTECFPDVHTVTVDDFLVDFMGYTLFEGRPVYYIGSDTYFDHESIIYNGAWHCAVPDYLVMRNTISDEGKNAIIRLAESDCTADRDLSEPRLFYCPEETKFVSIDLDPPLGSLAIAVEDSPPAGWTEVDNVSNGGFYDAVNHKVKWGPFFEPFPTSVSYAVTPPAEVGGEQCFGMATISVDGINHEFCGDICIDESCCPYAPAEDVASPCDGCADCSCGGGCQDGRVELCEVVGYACAWRHGCNDDIAGMTRSAYLWISGECYCWDEVQQNWYPHACESPASGCCEALEEAPFASAPDTGGEAHGALATLAAQFSPQPKAKPVHVGPLGNVGELSGTIKCSTPPGVRVTALALFVPRGWDVTQTSDNGAWDRVHRKLKWGPFFDEDSHTVSFSLRRTSRQLGHDRFEGSASFDGLTQPIRLQWKR